MNTNIGDIDRLIRMVVGGTLMLLFFFGPHTYWGLLGVIPLLTALIGFCPLYKVIGLSTNPHEKTAG